MKDKLNKEEKDLLESFNNNEWEKIEDHDVKIKAYTKVAENTLKKNQRINIRITQRDLTELKKKAAYDGIPYQTYVSSILHKFINGRLIEKVG